jgi:predicted ATPase
MRGAFPALDQECVAPGTPRAASTRTLGIVRVDPVQTVRDSDPTGALQALPVARRSACGEVQGHLEAHVSCDGPAQGIDPRIGVGLPRHEADHQLEPSSGSALPFLAQAPEGPLPFRWIERGGQIDRDCVEGAQEARVEGRRPHGSDRQQAACAARVDRVPHPPAVLPRFGGEHHHRGVSPDGFAGEGGTVDESARMQDAGGGVEVMEGLALHGVDTHRIVPLWQGTGQQPVAELARAGRSGPKAFRKLFIRVQKMRASGPVPHRWRGAQLLLHSDRMRRCDCQGRHAVRRIVLTGGPGAGKTAVLELVRLLFCEHVAVLPEAASIVFGGGFPRDRAVASREAGQLAIFHVQRALERRADGLDAAAVVLCDRGTVDGLAYWPGSPESFWTAVGGVPASEMARYDVVIHMHTPAADHGYQSSPLRIESAAEAVAADARIAEVWSSHPHRLFIDNTTDFLSKAARTLRALRDELPPCCRQRAVEPFELDRMAGG